MFKTFSETLKQIFSSKWRGVAYFLLLFIPMIYSMLVISSFWNPFHNVQKLKVAVVNLDKTISGNSFAKAVTEAEKTTLGQKEFEISVQDASDLYSGLDEKAAIEKINEDISNNKFASVILVPHGYGEMIKDTIKEIVKFAAGSLISTAGNLLNNGALTKLGINNNMLTNFLGNGKLSILHQLLNNPPSSSDPLTKIKEIIDKEIHKGGFDHRIQYFNGFKNNFLNGVINNFGSSFTSLAVKSLFPTISNLPIVQAIAKLVLWKPSSKQMLIASNIDNYGKGFSPFFIAISLWAGALAATFLIKNQRVDKNIGTFKTFFGKMMVWQITGFMQGILLAIGLLILGVNVNGGMTSQWKLIFIVLAISSLFSFMIQGIAYMFRYADVGKFIIVILLILDLVAASGSFPSIMMPSFFSTITPYLPWTYAINAIREVMYYPSVANVFADLGILLVFPIIFIILSLTNNYIFDRITLKKYGQLQQFEIETGDL